MKMREQLQARHKVASGGYCHCSFCAEGRKANKIAKIIGIGVLLHVVTGVLVLLYLGC